MATDTEVVKDLMIGHFATPLGNADAKTEVGRVFTDLYSINKATADSTDSSTTAATALPPSAAMYAGQVKSAFYCVSTTITAGATHNATLTLKAYPAAGGTGLTIATLTTTAAVTAFTRCPMTLATTASNLTVEAGSIFTLEISKGGSGITLPIGAAQIFVERTG